MAAILLCLYVIYQKEFRSLFLFFSGTNLISTLYFLYTFSCTDIFSSLISPDSVTLVSMTSKTHGHNFIRTLFSPQSILTQRCWRLRSGVVTFVLDQGFSLMGNLCILWFKISYPVVAKNQQQACLYSLPPCCDNLNVPRYYYMYMYYISDNKMLKWITHFPRWEPPT